jgi:hypothetical protein
MVRGPFRVLRPIGRGGMADVVLAESADGARVALKRVLPEHAGDDRFRRMFLDEARIAAALDHPGIVRVLGSGEDEGAPWIAMEPIDGTDAATWREAGAALGMPMPERAALRIALDVAGALAHAHTACGADGTRLGIVHRDVSPSNILVGRDGRVTLGDFGIAKARDRVEKTSVGSAKGKIAYMAPEQRIGGDVDPRTDVFALGCALHALLTGRSAVGDESDAAMLIAGSELPLAPDLAPDVRAIIARAVAPSRVRRFPGASAMADALEAALDARGPGDGRAELVRWIGDLDRAEQAERARTPVRHEADTVRAPGPRRVGRRRAATAGGIALALAGIGVASWARTTSRPSEAVDPRGAALTSREGAPAHAASVDEPAARHHLAPSERDVALAAPALVARDEDTLHGATPELGSPRARVAPREDSAAVRPRAETPDGPAARPRAALPDEPAVRPRAETGVLVVGGPAAIGSVVYVDGERVDFAPATVDVSVGAHAVEIRDLDGRVVGTRRAEVRLDHTRHSPARVVFP